MLARSLTLVAVLASVLVGAALRSVTAAPNPAASMTTPEHLRASPWWPTKSLPTQEGFAGANSCAQCHAEIVASQATSQMAHTLGLAAGSPILRQHPASTYRSGPYTYSVAEKGSDVTLAVTDGTKSDTALVRWAFGSGDVGQSYLWRSAGAFNESRFNYFASLHGFAATPGRLHGAPTSIDMALGRHVEDFEARSCFSCHVTSMSAAAPVDEASIVPGVGCEACHGPGRDHIAAAQAHRSEAAPAAAWNRRIVNSADLTPAQSVDFCGSCHSTPADVRLMGAVGLATVRFPAYRLVKSRCWGASGDDRLTCIACHDPHEPLERSAIAYDAACLACHTTKDHPRANTQANLSQPNATRPDATNPDAAHPGAACPVATSKCVTCHMPKFNLPEMHSSFTDHQIRIAKNNPDGKAAFPD